MPIVKRTQALMAIMKEVMFTMIVMMAKRVMIMKEATVNETAQVNEIAQYWSWWKLRKYYLYDQPAPFGNESLKKQPPKVFCKKRCSYKFRKIYRKTPVP